jgi:hypothetical protein
MRRKEHVRCSLLSVVLAAALAVTACGREEPAAPAATMATQSPEQDVNLPATVTGCLRAGDAENTFVLTTAQAAEGEPTATYHLVGTGGVDLNDHIGRRVEISGVVRSRQDVATRSTTDPAPRATGTGGETPAVSTSTHVALKQLDVREVRRLDGECEMK